MILWYEMKLSKHSFRMESFNLPLNYELRVWRQELQSDSPDCWSFKAMHNCQSLKLISQVKAKPKKKSSQYYTACVGLFFVCLFYFIFPFLSPSLRLCFSSDHLQVPEQQPFWIKANPVQSEPCTRLSVPIHLSREA